MSREEARGRGGDGETDPVARLERLAALRDKGVLSEEELQEAKGRLLAKLR